MIDTIKYDVVTLPGQDYVSPRQLYPEPAADEHDHGGPLLAGDPLGALIAAKMHSPFDLDVLAVPDVTDGHEVPQQPPAIRGGICGCITHVDVLCHEAGR
jgi:hypothetical protein